MSNLILICRIFTCLGINITDSIPKTTCDKILHLLRNIWFPLILHLNIIITQLLKISRINYGTIFQYGTILDFVMVVVPVVLWWSVYNRKGSITSMINQMSHFKRNRASKLSSTAIIYCSTVYWIAMIFFMLFTAICRHVPMANDSMGLNDTLTMSNDTPISHNSVKCNWDNLIAELILFIQELFFPFMFSLLCFTLCIRLTENLKYFIISLKQLQDNNGEHNLLVELKEYLAVVKCAECFATSFSNPLFLFSCQFFFYMTLSFLDLFLISDIDHLLAMHTLVVTLSLIVLTAILAFCAAEIPLKIAAIKRILNNIKTEQLFENIQTNNETIDAVLSRETLKITAGNVVSFDKSFLIKCTTAIIIHSTIFYQLTILSKS